MRRTWLWWALGLVGLALALWTAFPGDVIVGRDDPTGLAGIYTVNGVDPTGAGYSGTLVVKATDDPDRYDMEWLITGTLRRGTGEQRGDVVEVVWESEESASGPARGTGRYDVGPDGGMTGIWTVEGQDATGSEEIFPEA